MTDTVEAAEQVAALVGSVTRGRSSRPATARAVSMALPPPAPTMTSTL